MKTSRSLYSSLLVTLALISGALAQSPAHLSLANVAAAPTSAPNVVPVVSPGPTSPLYLADGEKIWVIQGSAVIDSWTQHHGEEFGIAVLGTIRTVGHSTSAPGSEYTLEGTYTGVDFTSGTDGVFDGTTDGKLIYAADYYNGDVYSFNTDWTNPKVFFSTPSGYLGVAFDPTNNTLWLATFDGSTVENRSLSGTILSSFTVPFSSITCLALDPADNTLWMGSQDTEGTFYQYTKSGVSLGSLVYPELVNVNTLGGEFASNAERQGHVFGQATIASPDGGQASIMIDVRNDNKKGRITGRVAYSDAAANLSMSTGQITYLVINGRTAGIAGSATVPGKKKNKRLSFTIHVTDNGPGSTDTFSIVFDNGYSASGTLTSGDITVD